MNKNNATLSRKLFIRIAPTILVTILLIGGFAFHSADKEINTMYDAQLISNANVLWMLISDELKEEEAASPREVNNIDLMPDNQAGLNDSTDDYGDSRMFRIWKGDKVMMYSDTALPASVPQQKHGFSTVYYKNDTWRIYTLPIPNTPLSIEVGEKMDLRNTLVANILLNLALPLLLLVPIVGMLIWISIGSGLGAIRNLVEHIRKRSPDDLSHIDTYTLPKDLTPLGKSLNQLFTKLEHSFTIEKRFTDHAAHQLRTPLATVKLQLQMLANATNNTEKQTLIQELMLSNERATKLVSMLLTSARLNHQTIHLEQVNLYATTANVMAELGLLAKEKVIEMSLEGPETALIMADEALLKLMLSNVIENAIKYTPTKGKVRVAIAPQAQAWKLSITDTGHGIPEEERDLVFQRFYRVSTPEAEGSGLGLAIVAEIVERFSGSIELKTPESGIGLCVEIILPTK